MEDVIVSFVWQLAAPSLLSTPLLSAVLQSAKLLSVSLERHMLSLSSHYLLRDSLCHTLSLSHVHRHSYISFDMDLADVNVKTG